MTIARASQEKLQTVGMSQFSRQSTEAALTEGTSRIEAFSDGVFAIAITLLILEIRLPDMREAEGSLLAGLLALWPSYFAFALSFFVILVTWIAHHDLMGLIRVTTQPVQLANGFVLFYVTFIPFPTAVLAAHLMDRKSLRRSPSIAERSLLAVAHSTCWSRRSRAVQGSTCRPSAESAAAFGSLSRSMSPQR